VAGQPFSVVIDYAHTAESLTKVLDELAPAEPGAGLIAVFGSAGDRDRSKREIMGRVAGDRCRLVVLADEDPRGEDPMAILEAIASGAEAAGLRPGRDLLLIPDRAEAIRTAIRAAQPGDAVPPAATAPETPLAYAAREVPRHDAAVAEAAIEMRLRRKRREPRVSACPAPP
jgi:UDP-N-acetylmuramoyl-L-alanyl-D-glutamate--2,6-diaminopimelate ligase